MAWKDVEIDFFGGAMADVQQVTPKCDICPSAPSSRQEIAYGAIELGLRGWGSSSMHANTFLAYLRVPTYQGTITMKTLRGNRSVLYLVKSS